MISALADGQLQGPELVRGIQAIATEASARQDWDIYHLIGDVLRSRDVAVAGSVEAFVGRVEDRLGRERIIAPELIAGSADLVRAPAGFDSKIPAANDGLFRWKLVAGAASVAAVAAVAWNLVGGLATPSAPQLATGPSQGVVVQASGSGGLMLRDERLDELLAAHRQLGGASALQMPAGLLRNATFEGPPR